MRIHTTIIFSLSLLSTGYTQELDSLKNENRKLDSLYISEVQDVKGRDKVLHAEPLYIDLIRDLGARKGEKEWNIGVGLIDNLTFDTYEALIEYEFAPIDRLGLEIELPFTIVAAHNRIEENTIPASRLNSIKAAAQWSFYVSEKQKLSMALGYIHEFELSPFKEFGSPVFTGNVFNPFVIAAKRFGSNFHTLVYTGPVIGKSKSRWHSQYDINTNFHYMISGTRNFIGLEINKSITNQDIDMVIRPQMRLGIMDNLLIGIVGGVPVNREEQRFSMFTRLIWEPHSRKKK
jgi:hypothetical protein